MQLEEVALFLRRRFSGVNADTGQPLSEERVRARHERLFNFTQGLLVALALGTKIEINNLLKDENARGKKN